MKGKLSIIIMAVGMALILAATIVINVLALGQFDNLLEQIFRKSDAPRRGDTRGADVDSYT